MRRLKADLHTHCGDDPRDDIDYSAEMLIDAAAALAVDVLAIACHWRVVGGRRLTAYAARRNVLLVPAIELHVEGKHVVVLNPDADQAQARTFDELRALGRREAAIIAPHPFYLAPICLGSALAKHIDLFDAVEYCSLHFRGLDLNRRAVRAARRHGLPLLGTSDTHALPYRDGTFTWIEAEPTVRGVIEAVRAGRVEVETSPQPLGRAARTISASAWHALREAFRDAIHVGQYADD